MYIYTHTHQIHRLPWDFGGQKGPKQFLKTKITAFEYLLLIQTNELRFHVVTRFHRLITSSSAAVRPSQFLNNPSLSLQLTPI